MTDHLRLLGLAAAALLAAGCSSAPSRFYTLESTAAARADTRSPLADTAVIIGPVSVPASVDRDEFVVQVAPNRVEIDEFNRWISPPSDAIARTLAVDLAALLGTPRVAVAPLASFDADYRVSVDVQRFESVPGEHVLLEAVWVVRRTKGRVARSGRTVAREPVSSAGFAALAASHSRAVAKMSADVAAAIAADGDGH